MQSRIANRNAADEHRFEPRNRCYGTRTSNLELDGFNFSQFFLRWKLVRYRPSRRSRNEAEFFLHFEAINFVNYPIDLVAQLIPTLTDTFIVIQAPLHAANDTTLRANLDSPFLQLIDNFTMARWQMTALSNADRVGIHVQWSFSRQFRVQLTQTSGRCVTGIYERLFSGGARSVVVRIEPGFRHEDLTANFKSGRITTA